MAINQCQSGIDDATDIPTELFDLERNKLGKKGRSLVLTIKVVIRKGQFGK